MHQYFAAFFIAVPFKLNDSYRLYFRTKFAPEQRGKQRILSNILMKKFFNFVPKNLRKNHIVRRKKTTNLLHFSSAHLPVFCENSTEIGIGLRLSGCASAHQIKQKNCRVTALFVKSFFAMDSGFFDYLLGNFQAFLTCLFAAFL
jgi:hypothetical protein